MNYKKRWIDDLTNCRCIKHKAQQLIERHNQYCFLLAKHFRDPEQKLKCIHIAGTTERFYFASFGFCLQEEDIRLGLLYFTAFKRLSRADCHQWKTIQKNMLRFHEQDKAFFEANELSF